MTPGLLARAECRAVAETNRPRRGSIPRARSRPPGSCRAGRTGTGNADRVRSWRTRFDQQTRRHCGPDGRTAATPARSRANRRARLGKLRARATGKCSWTGLHRGAYPKTSLCHGTCRSQRQTAADAQRRAPPDTGRCRNSDRSWSLRPTRRRGAGFDIEAETAGVSSGRPRSTPLPNLAEACIIRGDEAL